MCLMGLGHLQAVPVDVHMWRLAQRDYGMGGALATLTPSVYRAVGEAISLHTPHTHTPLCLLWGGI